MRRFMSLWLFTYYLILTACATIPVPAESTITPTATALPIQPSPTVIPTVTPTAPTAQKRTQMTLIFMIYADKKIPIIPSEL